MRTAADIESVARWIARRDAYRALDIEVTPETIEILKDSIRSFEEEHWCEFAEQARRRFIAADPSST